MDFLELVKKRRSCRKYSNRSVPFEALQKCLEAARLSPSACNSQPWHFFVVKDKDLKERLAKKAFSGIYSMNSFAQGAQVLVAVLREKSSYLTQLGGFLRGTQYSLIDLGIACEHFVLQAAQEGLGTCWIGFFNEKEVKKTLNIAKHKKVDMLISVGYPQDDAPVEKKRRGVLEICDFC